MMKQCAIAAAVAVSVMTAAGASAQEKPKETTIVIKDDATPKVKKAGKAIADGTITTTVKTRLMKDKVARGASIDVDTKEGVVTISGSVPTEADKLRIGRLVAKTTGVKSVANNLTVK